MQLNEEDNRLTVRNRLQAAAGRRGLALTFRRTTGPLLRFRVDAAVNGLQNHREPVPPQLEPPIVAEVPQGLPATAVAQDLQPTEAPKRRGRPPRSEVVAAALAPTETKRRRHKPRSQT